MELAEQVMIKYPTLHQGRLQDRWIGYYTDVRKSGREDEHPTINAEWRRLIMARSARHLTNVSKWKPDVLKRIRLRPTEPEIKELNSTEPWRRYTT